MPNNSPRSFPDDCMLVLVHLGSSPANHLWLNMKSILKRFPEIQIAFVSDQNHPNRIEDKRIKFFQYQRASHTVEAFALLAHDKKFRSGFWQYTLERFLALNQFHQTCPQVKILHIESDILLLPNFPFKKIFDTSKLAWMRVDENRDVAAILYSPNGTETAWLASEILQHMSRDSLVTDMTSTNRIRKSNSDRITVLPSYSSLLGKYPIRESDKDTYILKELSESFEEFNGIFDPAAIGMWLTGSDPRNYYGKQIFFDSREINMGGTFFDPSLLKYSFSDDGELFCRFDDNLVRIWSLHVHSKDPLLLGEDWQSRLENLVSQSDKGIVISQFHLKILLKLLSSNFQEQTLVSFILHLPQLRPLMRILRELRSIIKHREA